MKKILSVFFAVAVLFLLSSCGSNKTVSSNVDISSEYTFFEDEYLEEIESLIEDEEESSSEIEISSEVVVSSKIEISSKIETSSMKENSSKIETSSMTVLNSTERHKVYITPTGKRFHFNSNCGGKNSYETTLDHAESIGLTPCKKCAR